MQIAGVSVERQGGLSKQEVMKKSRSPGPTGGSIYLNQYRGVRSEHQKPRVRESQKGA